MFIFLFSFSPSSGLDVSVAGVSVVHVARKLLHFEDEISTPFVASSDRVTRSPSRKYLFVAVMGGAE